MILYSGFFDWLLEKNAYVLSQQDVLIENDHAAGKRIGRQRRASIRVPIVVGHYGADRRAMQCYGTAFPFYQTVSMSPERVISPFFVITAAGSCKMSR